MSVFYILILLNAETLHTYVALRDLLHAASTEVIPNNSPARLNAFHLWKKHRMKGSRWARECSIESSPTCSSNTPSSQPGRRGELAGSTRSLPVARAVGRPTRSVTWRFFGGFWELSGGKSRQRRLKQIRRVFINHWLTDDSGDRQRVSEEPVD